MPNSTSVHGWGIGLAEWTRSLGPHPGRPHALCRGAGCGKGRGVAMRDAKAFAPVIGIVVKRWPRLSETFVLNEILGLERAGLQLRSYALMDPHEPAAQAEINAVQAPVSYLRTGTRADLRVLLVAQLALLRRHGVSHVHAQFAHGPTSVAHLASLLGAIPFSFTGHAKDIYVSPPDLLAVKIAAAR